MRCVLGLSETSIANGGLVEQTSACNEQVSGPQAAKNAVGSCQCIRQRVISGYRSMQCRHENGAVQNRN